MKIFSRKNTEEDNAEKEYYAWRMLSLIPKGNVIHTDRTPNGLKI